MPSVMGFWVGLDNMWYKLKKQILIYKHVTQSPPPLSSKGLLCVTQLLDFLLLLKWDI